MLESTGTIGTARIPRDGWTEIHVCGFGVPGDLVDAVKRDLGSCDAVHVRLFAGSSELAGELERIRPGQVFVDRYLAPKGTTLEPGIQAWGLATGPEASLEIKTFPDGSRGWLLRFPRGRMGFVSRIAAPSMDRLDSYEATFEGTMDRLATLGFQAGELARTWCFFRDVLIEYPAFNRIRRQSFQRHDLLPGPLPASTGIQGIPDGGQHLAMDALAFSGPDIVRSVVANPSQCEAEDYGSLFSRGIRIDGAGPSQWIVSGMAAIDEEGLSLHPGDPEAQVDDTLARATRLLHSNGLDWGNVVSGTAFLHPDYVERLVRKLSDTVLGKTHFARSAADVCRPELLFEIEWMAFGPRP